MTIITVECIIIDFLLFLLLYYIIKIARNKNIILFFFNLKKKYIKIKYLPVKEKEIVFT